MIDFILNGEEKQVHDGATVQDMIDVLAPIEEEDMMYFITINGSPIKGRTQEICVHQGDSIKLLKMCYGG